METYFLKLIEVLFTETGLISVLLFFSNVVWFKMYVCEKKDRRTSWESDARFKLQIIDTLKEMVPILEIVKDRTKR